MCRFPFDLPKLFGVPRHVGLGLLLLALVVVRTASATDGSEDQRFLAGLRQRGLFKLAETYCRDRLREPQLPEVRRAELTIELSRCLAEQAASSPPGLREPIWQQAQGAIDQFIRQHTASPRLLLVRLQGALGLLSRGELARQEAQVLGDTGPSLDQARDYLRAAVRQLTELADEVDHKLRRQNLAGRPDSQQGSPDQLTDQQLVSLQKNIQYQLARALRNQGQCYPSESADLANSLAKAVELLEPLANLDSTHPLAWKSRIGQVVCYRLLVDLATARRKLDALLQQKPPPSIALRGRAERIRLALAGGKVAEAVAGLSAGRELDGNISSDLDYAWLEVYMAAWRAAADEGDGQKAAGWQAKATTMVRVIERDHGPYWGRRAEMLVAGSVGAAPDSSDLAALALAAESYYRSGRLDDAVAAYDRARGLAEKQGHGERAFELGYVAAAIEHKLGRHQESLRRYRQLALAMPRHEKAPDAHLLAIYHAGQLAKEQSHGTQPVGLEKRNTERVNPYADLLQEHLQIWPAAPSADKVRRKLGRLREHQGDWQNAIAAYRAISAGDPQYVETLDAADRCYRAWLDGRKTSGQPTEEIAAAAATWFESLIVGPQGQLPQSWSPVARRAALGAARLWLNYTPSGAARAERILSSALGGATDAPPQWTSAARALLVSSLAAGGRHGEAAEVLNQISAGSADQLLGMLQGLAHVAATARPEVRSELAALELRAVELLRPRRDQLSPGGQRSLDRIAAGALADAGRTAEALEAYRRLSRTYPRDGQIQEAYAKLITPGNDPASLKAALAKWREVEKNSRPGSDRWFRAKYAVVSLHCRLGNKEQAMKIVKLLGALHPEMGGPRMKAKFLGLLER